jgi:hypothetical protein
MVPVARAIEIASEALHPAKAAAGLGAAQVAAPPAWEGSLRGALSAESEPELECILEGLREAQLQADNALADKRLQRRNQEQAAMARQNQDRELDQAYGTAPWENGLVPKDVHDDLLRSLEQLKFTADMYSAFRQSVMRDGDKKANHGKGVKSFKLDQHMHPELYGKLARLIKAHDPEFSFEYIYINHDWQCARHMDERNSGPSYICGFGAYTGGQLLVEPEGVDDPQQQQWIDVQSTLYRFDGARQYHEVNSFEGSRWTAVFYGWDSDTDPSAPDPAAASSQEGGEQMPTASAPSSSPSKTSSQPEAKEVEQEQAMIFFPLVAFMNGRSKLILPKHFSYEIPMMGTCLRKQLPLKLAWAITAHKSQGMTLDYAIVDLKSLGASSFNPDALVYVALSRVKSMECLELIGYDPSMVRASAVVRAFYAQLEGAAGAGGGGGGGNGGGSGGNGGGGGGGNGGGRGGGNGGGSGGGNGGGSGGNGGGGSGESGGGSGESGGESGGAGQICMWDELDGALAAHAIEKLSFSIEQGLYASAANGE